MKKSELKELINPIVKECVTENIQTILLESGLLSQVISEVVKGLQPVIVESKTRVSESQEVQRGSDSHMREILKKSQTRNIVNPNREAIEEIKKTSFKGINIFEGIKDPIPDEPVQGGPGAALTGIAPDDPGVDISGLFDPRIAKALLKGTK